MGTTMNNRIIHAVQYAALKHASQVRKYTGKPYITHPMRVMCRVMLLPGTTEEMVMAAISHDLIEDCGVTVPELHGIFGARVAKYVEELTNPSKGRPDLNRAAKKQLDREHLKTVSQEAKWIKLIDRADNLSEMSGAPLDFIKLYCQESRLLVEALMPQEKSPIDIELEDECMSTIGMLEYYITVPEIQHGG